MKKIMLSVVGLFMGLLSIGQSKVVKDASGNFHATTTEHKASVGIKTNNTYTDTKGNVWPVFQTEGGRLYALRTSKSGNQYKQYLKTN